MEKLTILLKNLIKLKQHFYWNNQLKTLKGDQSKISCKILHNFSWPKKID